MQKNFPSVKRIMEIGVDQETAVKVRAIMGGTRAFVLDTSEAAETANRQSYNPHARHYLKMLAIDQLLGTYGVEGDENIEYCNTGDSYALTVIYHEGRFKVSSWGDVVERNGLYSREF